MKKIVIIGGDAAGMSAAARASRGSEPTELVVFEKTNTTSYAACGLPYFVGGHITEERELIARTPEAHRANGIDVRTQHEVTGIDTKARSVMVRSLTDDTSFTESYDELVIATGSRAIWPPFPGIDAAGIFSVHTIPDAKRIRCYATTAGVQHAVVVGGGYIGLEMVEAFLDLGLEVTLIERLPQPMASFDPEMAELITAELQRLGVNVHLSESVERFVAAEDGSVAQVVTNIGTHNADIVVMGLGAKPNTELAEAAGIAIGPSGGIATNAQMRTYTPHVWAAGDCAEALHQVSLSPVNIALGTHANKQGRTIGMNVSGTPARFPGVLGTAITKVREMEIARTGLSVREAMVAGFDAVSAQIRSESRAHYYPGSEPLTVRVVAERGSGRLLGAQIVGGHEAGKRIDALAVGIAAGLSATEFSLLDLAYAPPFSPVYDPILIAARIAGERAG